MTNQADHDEVARLKDAVERLIGEILAGGKSAGLGLIRSQPAPELLTVEDVAERCSVTRPTVRSWIHSGRLVAKRAGHRWLVSAADLEKFLANRDAGESDPVGVDDGVADVMSRIARMSSK